jgi:inosine-uridine nucleoside N-ribohydrolase
MKKRKVILDVDPGSDDAVAIMSALLCEELDVLGITTVHGNLPLQYTLENTLRVVEFLNSNVPVFSGCPYPLVQDLIPGRLHNTDEMKKECIIDGKVVAVHEKELPLPKATIKPQKEHACSWILRTLKESKEQITLIPVGAMTNIATVLRMDPSVSEHIDEIICMGGGVNVHNRSFRSETNFFNDPEAAKIMLDSGIKTVIVTLDATHSSWFGYEEVEKLREINNPAANFAADMLYHRIYAANLTGARKEPKSALHDVLAVCTAIDISILTDLRHEACDIDIAGGVSTGALMVSSRYKYSKPEKPTWVAYGTDGEMLFSMLCSHLKRFKG